MTGGGEFDLGDPRGVFERASDIQILDCREPFEWEAGRIEGALHVPLASVMAGEDGGMSTDRPVVVVCRSGQRSELAALMLSARGFQAHNMVGGMEAWAALGLPFAAGDGGPGIVA